MGVFYFVQKQKLEESQLFDRLFTRFNERYATLHPALQLAMREEGVLPQSSRDTLSAYFNLCAEEYLFYVEGRILPCVWQSWCRGMREYLNHRRIVESRRTHKKLRNASAF